MPRNGSGTYTYPPGTRGAPATPIESLKYNNYIDDVAIDLNTPRPIVAGGTGGTTVNDTLDNLSAEKFKQVVTNWDTTVWRAGSFYAASAALGTAPVGGHAFAGICYFANATDVVCEATDITDPANPDKYIRVMAAGVWSIWTRTNPATSSANLGEYTFDSTVTFPPTSGQIRFNNATQNSTTEVFISHLSATGFDNSSQITLYLKSGVDFLIQDKDEGAKYKVFTATANAVLSSGDFRVTVTLKSGGIDVVSAQRMLVAALSETERTQNRQNIYAAPFDAMAYNGMQINGSMDVSQEKGAAATALTSSSGSYAIDGWNAVFISSTAVMQAAQSASGPYPSGFQNFVYLRATTGAAFSGSNDLAQLYTPIEGYRIGRLGFGNASAQSITIGFWINALITGTMAVALQNSGNNRSIVADVVISAANTWEYHTVTFPGDTAGTWLITNGTGLFLMFTGACGSARRTATPNVWVAGDYRATSSTTNFFPAGQQIAITGVVILPGIEAPSAARSSYVMRPYGQELSLSQRYYWKDTGQWIWAEGVSTGVGSINIVNTVYFPVTMRTTPTVVTIPTFSSGGVSAPIVNNTSPSAVNVVATSSVASGIRMFFLYASGAFSADARL